MATFLEKLSNGWKRIAADLDPKNRAEKQLLEALKRDYFEEKMLAQALEQESDRIPYAHLRKKLIDIAEAEKRHARLLEEKIVELGDSISEHARDLQKQRDEKQFESTLDLLKILEEEKAEYIEYLDAMALAREAKRNDIQALLDQIREEEAVHRKQLMDILAKLNPLPGK